MTSDGTPWRPLVHVLDICHAIVCAVESPREPVHNQIFNVGHSVDNYRVREIAEIVGGVFSGCKVTFGPPGGASKSQGGTRPRGRRPRKYSPARSAYLASRNQASGWSG